MNERRKHQAECGADESMHVHSEKRRDFQSKTFHESTVFTLLPPRPGSYGDTGLSSRGSELLGLKVQGLCCPLQQRPCSGRIAHMVKPQSRGGGDGSLPLLSSLKGKLESRAKPASRSGTVNRPEMTPEVGAPSVCHHRDRVREEAETLTPPCDNERKASHGQPGAAKVSELHLYLPSSLCDDEEQDAGTEEMRSLEEEINARGSVVKPNKAYPPIFPSPSQTNQDKPESSTLQPTI